MCEGLFYGSVTVGDRGQVVIPAALRREYGISAGDRLLVFRGAIGGGLMLAKSELFQRFLEQQLDLLVGELRRPVDEHPGPDGDSDEEATQDGGGDR
jgi:AbrB family looped-hinge helix DNA binding protein